MLLFAFACAVDPDQTFTEYDPNVEPQAEEAAGEPLAVASADEPTGLIAPPVWMANEPRTSAVVGLTAPTMGRWIYPGSEPGYAAGEAACRAVGATHVCTPDEMDAASEIGAFHTLRASTRVWVRGSESAADCRRYGYQGAHENWNGSNARIEVGLSPDGHPMATFAIEYAPPSVEDPACLRDLSACDAVVPHGFECNVPRSIACCG